MKVSPDADTGFYLTEVAGQVADELFAGNLAEGFVKSNNVGGFQPERGQDFQFFGQRINQGRHVGRARRWRWDGGQMSRPRHGLARRGVGEGLAEDALVAEVNAVKNANGRADGARAGLQIGGGVQ